MDNQDIPVVNAGEDPRDYEIRCLKARCISAENQLTQAGIRIRAYAIPEEITEPPITAYEAHATAELIVDSVRDLFERFELHHNALHGKITEEGMEALQERIRVVLEDDAPNKWVWKSHASQDEWITKSLLPLIRDLRVVLTTKFPERQTNIRVEPNTNPKKTHRYYIYDRIQRTVVMEIDVPNGAVATEEFDKHGYKDNTHYLFCTVSR